MSLALYMGMGAGVDIEKATKQPSEVMTMNDIFIEAKPRITERDEIKGLIISFSAKYGVDDKCYDRIVECESNYRNVPNSKYGGDYGLGPAQLIKSTAKYCSEKLGKEIDRSNIVDNIECGAYLLSESKTGYYHWGLPDSWWGSYHCWKKDCVI